MLDALTQNTYQCLVPGQSYYVQVFTPNNAIGTITCEITAVKSSDQTCQPTFALPVTLMDISAERINNDDALLQWSVIEEQDNSHWDVYRSFDGESFKKIGTVKSTGGSGVNTYSYIDRCHLRHFRL